MLETFLRARRIVALAALAVVLASSIILSSFHDRLRVPCHGTLEPAPLTDLPSRGKRHDAPVTSGVRLVYEPHGMHLLLETECPCQKELEVPWRSQVGTGIAPPQNLVVRRNAETGLYLVTDGARLDLMAFRVTDVSTRRVFRRDRILDPGNVSVLILLGAAGSLTLAFVRLARAASYVRRLSQWRAARRRDDGLVEDESGAVIARLGRAVTSATDLLVDPTCFEGRAVYRELPLLDQRHVAPGSHERWSAGTLRRLHDARTLAVLATVTTALSVGAHLLAR